MSKLSDEEISLIIRHLKNLFTRDKYEEHEHSLDESSMIHAPHSILDIDLADIESTPSLFPNQITDDIHQDEEDMNGKTRTWASVAAAVFTLTTVGIWNLRTNKEEAIKPNELFASYYQPFQNKSFVENKDVASHGLRQHAFKLYHQENYEQAHILFNQLLREDTDFDIVFFRANTFAVLGQYTQARNDFEIIPEGHQYYSPAQWYVGLCLIKEEKLDDATTQFLKIEKNPTLGYKREEVETLFKILD